MKRRDREERRPSRRDREDGGSTKFRFKFQRGDAAKRRARATQTGGAYDVYLNPNVPTFKPKGDHTVRICPRKGKVDHYGMEIFVHYGVGADEQTYLCLDKDKNPASETKYCPICAEYKKAKRKGDDDYAKRLAPKKKVLVYLVDRDNEDEGPMLYAMPWSLDRDFVAQATNRRTKELLYVEDDQDGHDLEFSKEGKGLKTKYIGVKVAHSGTPLCDDEDVQEKWLQYVIDEHPLEEQLVFYPEEKIEKALAGAADEDDDDEDRPRTRSERRRGRDDEDEEDERPRSRRRDADDDEDDDEDDEKPRGRRKASRRDDEDDDPPPRRSRREEIDDADEDLDEDDEDERPRSRRKASRRDDEEDDKPRRSKLKVRRGNGKDFDARTKPF